MRFPILALALVLAAPTICAQSANPTPPLSLAEALRLAAQSNPSVRAREAQLSTVEGSRREAAALLHNNPELGADLIRRRLDAPSASWNEWGLGIAQPFETGGQQAHRRDAADASMGAVRAEIDDAQRQAMATAASRFYAVLAAQQRLQIERRGVELFASTAAAVDKRRAAGEDTRLDANLALVEADRARNALDTAEDRLTEARSELATALQLPPSALPEVSGELGSTLTEAARYDLPRLLESARSQPRISALSAREAAARSRLELERANRSPNITVGLGVGQEGPSDVRERLGVLTLSVQLPLFNRNEAAIGQATSDVTQFEIERANVTRDSQARVLQLWNRLASQRARVQRLERSMVPTAEASQALAERSRQAGQIGLLDQLIVSRQALDAERELNDALADYQRTRIELELAAGWPL